MLVATDMQKQAQQPNSILLSGLLTRHCVGIALLQNNLVVGSVSPGSRGGRGVRDLGSGGKRDLGSGGKWSNMPPPLPGNLEVTLTRQTGGGECWIRPLPVKRGARDFIWNDTP
jgi:hypothetical protein